MKQLKSFAEFRDTCLESNQYLEEVCTKFSEKSIVKEENEEFPIKNEPEVELFECDEVKTEQESDSDTSSESVPEYDNKNEDKDYDPKNDPTIKIKRRGPYKKRKKDENEDNPILFCKNCPEKIFTNKYYYRQHLRSHKEGKYECHFCGRKYYKKSFLHGHIDRNHIEKDFAKKGPYECNLCERRYLTPLRLKQHLQIHRLKEKACPVCGLLTRHLTSHLLKHEEPAERFQCDKCEKNYKSEKHLLLHAIVHENKLFPCKECGKTFNTPEKVAAHARNVHNPNRPTFECTVCHKHFYYRKYLTGKKNTGKLLF